MQEGFPQQKESNSARKRRLAAEHNERVRAQAPTRSIESLTRTEKEELKALSKEVFGASSRWQSLIEKGYSKLLTEKVTECIPGKTEEEEGTTREVDAPVKRSDGAHQSVLVRHTVESVKEYMLQRKEQLDQIRAMIKKQQDEAREKKEKEELALKINEELQGSAL